MAKVYDIAVFKNEICPHGGIRLYWDGPEGFGQYDLVVKTEREDEEDPTDYELKIIGDSECMDQGEDKEFLKSLLISLLEFIEVE